MSIIIPTSYTTYGDSTTTEGSPLRKYILAQYRSDADLEWVGCVRAMIVTDELKWERFKNQRPKLRKEPDLWKKISKGVGQATIIVIDPHPYKEEIEQSYIAQGAEYGHDFDNKKLVNECATAIVAGTPFAYIPTEIAKVISWNSLEKLSNLEMYTPEDIRKKIGSRLSAAQIFAARSHATFDISKIKDSTVDTYRSPLAKVILHEILSTERVFDVENPKTIEVINEITEAIASQLSDDFPLLKVEKPLAREMDSHKINHLQAADIAAGWAREILELNDNRSLCNTFENVWINGKRLK